MKRIACLAVLVAVAGLSGCCTTCQTPWDYCNGVLGYGGCPYCDFGARCGSAFAPIGSTPPTTDVGPRAAGGGTYVPPAEEPGAEPDEALPPGDELERYDASLDSLDF